MIEDNNEWPSKISLLWRTPEDVEAGGPPPDDPPVLTKFGEGVIGKDLALEINILHGALGGLVCTMKKINTHLPKTYLVQIGYP